MTYRPVRSEYDKSSSRLRVTLLVSLALHILLFSMIGLAPPSLTGTAGTLGKLNVLLEKNPDEPIRAAAAAAPARLPDMTAQSSAEAHPAPKPEPTPSESPPPPPPVAAEKPATQDLLAVNKPDEPQEIEAFKLPNPPEPAPAISQIQPIAQPKQPVIKPLAPLLQPESTTRVDPPQLTATEITRAPAPPIELERIIAAPKSLETPAPLETLIKPEFIAPISSEILEPIAAQPIPTKSEPERSAVDKTPSSSQTDTRETASASRSLNKPAGNDISSVSGLDLSAIKKPAESPGPKLRFGERRKIIGLRDSDLTYQLYAESVRMKLERVGRLNYPAEASRRDISGTMVVLVSIREDGSLENFHILRPAHDLLNNAADRIVRMSSPFSPLPDRIKQDVDILTIQIIWTFRSSNQTFE